MVDTSRNLLANLVRKDSICGHIIGISGSSRCRNLLNWKKPLQCRLVEEKIHVHLGCRLFKCSRQPFKPWGTFIWMVYSIHCQETSGVTSSFTNTDTCTCAFWAKVFIHVALEWVLLLQHPTDSSLQTKQPGAHVLDYLSVVSITECAVLPKTGFPLRTVLKPVEQVNHEVLHVKSWHLFMEVTADHSVYSIMYRCW